MIAILRVLGKSYVSAFCYDFHFCDQTVYLERSANPRNSDAQHDYDKCLELGNRVPRILKKHRDIANFQLIKEILLLNVMMEINLNDRKLFRRISKNGA
jgi:hypothetical protein